MTSKDDFALVQERLRGLREYVESDLTISRSFSETLSGHNFSVASVSSTSQKSSSDDEEVIQEGGLNVTRDYNILQDREPCHLIPRHTISIISEKTEPNSSYQSTPSTSTPKVAEPSIVAEVEPSKRRSPSPTVAETEPSKKSSPTPPPKGTASQGSVEKKLCCRSCFSRHNKVAPLSDEEAGSRTEIPCSSKGKSVNSAAQKKTKSKIRKCIACCFS